MLAFGFTNLAMLGWLAAAAAPLLIHLWSRHRFREAPWAAMQFLLTAMKKNARRMQLQQWLLLAVRTLLIVLVVLAVAEPYGDGVVAGSTGGPVHKVLALDGSYSMAYRDEAGSHFERAKKMAARLVRESRPGDTFTVILMASPAKTIIGQDTVDPASVAAQIESLAQRHTSADLAATLSLVHDALAAGETARFSPARHEIYFFTDLQRATWQLPGSHAPRGNPIARRSRGAEAAPATQSVENSRSHAERGNEDGGLAALAERATLTVIDVGQPRASNLAVTRFATADPYVTVDRDVALEVTLHQFGHEPRPGCALELLVDDVPVAEQTVDVPAGGEATVRFSHRFRSPGEYTLAVRAAGDRLAIDNARWLILPVREEIRVLCVAGRAGAARYLADALNPNPAATSAIRPIIVSEGDLAELELTDFDCVFLCNVAQLTDGEALRLTRYAAEGGGVVVFLGDRVIPRAYNAIADFAGSHALRGNESNATSVQSLLPARIGQVVSQPQFGLDPLEYRHPIVAPFRGQERAGLLTTPVARYYKLELSPDRPDAKVAAALPGGDPFIVSAPLGRGRTVLVATDGSLSSVVSATGEPWTTWPTWPSFLPMVRELLAYAVAGQHSDWQQPVGASLEGPLAGTAPSTSAGNLEIVRPDGRSASVAMHTSGGGTRWSYSGTDLSGIYSLRGLPQDEPRLFAVNVDTAESDLTKIDAQQLPPQLVVRDTWQNASEADSNSVVSHAAWDEQLLWIALGLLFVESFLAWQFGRGAA